jgi:spore germination protein
MKRENFTRASAIWIATASVLCAVGVTAFSIAPAMAATTAKTTTAKVAVTPLKYGVWLPFWQSQNGAQDIALNLTTLSEVSPFSYEIVAGGNIKDDLNIGNGSWAAWFSAVHDAGAKIIPTIAWFDTNSIYNLLSNANARQAEEDQIAALVKMQNFDGIDIDFEAMSPSTRPYYSLFIQGLAQRLHPAGKVLTCTVQPRTPPDQIYTVVPTNIVYPENYTVLNKYCDEVRLMAYDQETTDLTLDASKGNGNLYAPVADPAWVKSVIQEALQWISPRKIMLGIPTYGYEYEVSWLDGVTTYQRVRAFDYLDAMDRADSLGIEPTRDNAGELSFTYASSTYIAQPDILVTNVQSTEPALLKTVDPNASTTFFVSFPDADSILANINLAKQFGLRGAMLFKADGNIDPMVWQYMD